MHQTTETLDKAYLEYSNLTSAQTARELELSRLLQESKERESELLMIIGNIEQIRSVEGNSITILCDDPETFDTDRQSAVEFSGDFTDWQVEREYASDWTKALKAAADRSRRHYAQQE